MTIIATAAALIVAAVAQPTQRRSGGLARVPITSRSLVRSKTNIISGGVRTPFTTADQKSIATALKPTTLMAMKEQAAVGLVVMGLSCGNAFPDVSAAAVRSGLLCRGRRLPEGLSRCVHDALR